MERITLTLSELQLQVKESIKNTFPGSYWIKAEISELKENAGGHCYMELVEKGEGNAIVARAKGIIWSYVYRILKPYFISATQRPLAPGLSVLIQVIVEFHELYGLSLIVKDIDPAYTIGEWAMKKIQVIQQLKDEGVYDMNRQLQLPLVPQRIAVISSKTAAGFEDFVSHIENNTYGYKVKWKLFPAVMQGEETEKSVIAALEKINKNIALFDAVAIIRGGGAQSDLSSFDSYWLAYHVAQFPLPVLTGIGHEQDDSVTDMVAHTRLKTPTAVADFILSLFMEYEALLDRHRETLTSSVKQIVHYHSEVIATLSSQIPLIAKKALYAEREKLFGYASDLKSGIVTLLSEYNKRIEITKPALRNAVTLKIKEKKNEVFLIKNRMQFAVHKKVLVSDKKLDLIENTLSLSDPCNILQKGYSLTLYNGKSLKDVTHVSAGAEIETILCEGRIKSRIAEVINRVNGTKQFVNK